MRTKSLICVGAFLAIITVNNGQAADLQIKTGTLTDTRMTVATSAKLQMELKFLGAAVEGVKAVRCTATNALDNVGGNLLRETTGPGEFSEVDSNCLFTIELKSPLRKATFLREVSGTIELFKPENDPSSTASFIKFVGKQPVSLVHRSLSAAGVEMTVLSKEKQEEDGKTDVMGEFEKVLAGLFGGTPAIGENGVIIRIKDPQSKLIKVAFLDAAGKIIEQKAAMTTHDVRLYDFSAPLPEDAVLRLYIATPKSLIKIPFVLKDIVLP